jgi:tRNA(Ile)-lysidine synthase
MVMATVLHAQCPSLVVALATFDHGTGAAASEAVSLVRRWGAARGIPVHAGNAVALPPTEAAWRTARWEFLRTVSDAVGAPIATAHTEDDQAETVFIRLLRNSGVRGLAGLLAAGPVLRPLLGLSRGGVRDLAADGQVPFRDDPSNSDLRFLRNRVRLELLPAIERETPGFRAWLLAVGRRAAAWRTDVAAAVDEHWRPDVAAGTGVALVPRQRGRTPEREEAALFWPEVAGRVGVTLDRRGTARLASFTTKRVGGLRMPLAGGAIVTSTRAGWSLQRAGAS